MGGWFVDVFVGYLITLCRIVARSRRARKSKTWPEASAVVCGINCPSQGYMPRPAAEIAYTYRFEGGYYGGVNRKPFFFEDSAKAYAGQFAQGDTLVIRVKPGEAETSVVRDEDQALRFRRF